MPPPNHDSLPKGIPKIKSQASTAQNLETLQSQSRQGRKKRLSLNRLRVLHGRRISIKVVNARAVGGLVLVVSEFSATGSGPTAGKILHGKSSHALARVDDTWLSAMHSAINSAPTPVTT
jgi:hypothetical protein